MKTLSIALVAALFVGGCGGPAPSQPSREDSYQFPPATTVEPVDNGNVKDTPPEAPDPPEKRATQVFWEAVQSGDGSALGSLVPEGHDVKVILEHTIAQVDPQEFSYNGPEGVQEWLTALHTPTGAFDMVWGDAFQVESGDERIIVSCENMTCIFDGGLAHNTLFLNSVRFERDQDGNLIIDEVQMIHGD